MRPPEPKWVFVPIVHCGSADGTDLWAIAPASMPGGKVTVEHLHFGGPFAGTAAIPGHAHAGIEVFADLGAAMHYVGAHVGPDPLWSTETSLRLVVHDGVRLRSVVLQSRGPSWYTLRVDFTVPADLELPATGSVPTFAHAHGEAPEGPYSLPDAMMRALWLIALPPESQPPCSCSNVDDVIDADFEEA